MTHFVPKIVTAVFLSLLINAPFAIGEFLTREITGPRAYFPFKLMVGLWLHMALLVFLLIPIIQTSRDGSASKKPILLSIRLLILGILAWAWITLIIDQWPCFFLGGSGC
ncbi:MAG: hypothetical protein AAB365_01315 [Patescibacteria group bacterium]